MGLSSTASSIQADLVTDGLFVYQYDAFNRLLQINLPGNAVFGTDGRIVSGLLGSLVLRYQYDAFGRLIRKHLPPLQSDYQTEDHYYDGVRRIQTVGYRYEDPNGPSFGFGGTFGAGEGELGEVGLQSPPVETNWTEREYVYGPDYVDEFVAEFDQDGAPLFFLQDANYNVVSLTDANGAIVEQRVYEPYGELAAGETFGEHGVSRVGHQGLFFERTGGDVDAPPIAPGALGFYYNRNRMYSPTLGRFMQRDPNETALPIATAMSINGAAMDILFAGFNSTGLYGDGMNLFQYLGSNPITGRDPSGLEGSYVELVFATGEEAAIGAALAEGAAGAMGFLQAMAGQFLANSLMMSLQIMAIEFSMSNQSGAFDMSVWTAMSDEYTRFLQAASGNGGKLQGFKNTFSNLVNNGFDPRDMFNGLYDKVFRTSQGPVRVLGEVKTSGNDAILKDVAVYPEGADKLQVGVREVVSILRNQLASDFRSMGFDRLIVQGYRVSGGNPGRQSEIIIKLK